MKKQQLLAFAVHAEGSRMDLDVYETIGESFWGDSVSAKDVLAKVRDSKPREIFMRVNSGGGDLFDAIAISSLLKATGAKITVSIDGVAASAATHLWPVGAHVTMARNAVMMIHKAWSVCMGNASEMNKLADTLSKADELQANNYAQYAQSRGVVVTSEKFASLMSEETWMTADEALANGLIDAIGEDVSVAASVDVSAFRRPPASLIDRAVAAMSFTAPAAALTEGNPAMDIKAMQAAIEAKDAELATIKSERDTLNAKVSTLQVEVQALTTQNAALVTERDEAVSKVEALESKAIESEVDALVPNILDPAERDNFVALAKTSRKLFDAMVSQRKPRSLTDRLVAQDIEAPAPTVSAGDAEDQFNALVEKDLATA